jgi:predicted nucleic acid-binding protein
LYSRASHGTPKPFYASDVLRIQVSENAVPSRRYCPHERKDANTNVVRARRIDPCLLALQDEEDPRADAAFARIKAEEAVVSSLWWFEIRNILVVNERRKRIAESDTAIFLRDLAGLRIRVDREPQESVVLRLARTHRLSVYDASYLELALREGYQWRPWTPSLQPQRALRALD